MDQVTTARFLDFSLNFRTGELCRRGRTIRLPEKPFLALVLLIEYANETVTREALYRCLWPEGTFVEFDDNLNATIKRLREALGDCAGAPRIIETIPRSGYRFIAPLEMAPPPQTEPAALPIPASEQSAQCAIRFRSYWGHRLMLAGAAVAVVVTLAASIRMHHAATTQAQQQRKNVKLAVVSFNNATHDRDRNFLSQGLFEEIRSRLSRLTPEQLTVISIDGAKSISLPSDEAIRGTLGVDYILRGALRNDRGGLALVTELKDAHSLAHLWTAEFRLPLQEVFVQHDLADRIARSLSLRTPPRSDREQLSRGYTSDVSAHEAYLRGREILLHDSGSDAKRALDWFEKAINSDPEYALPYAGLAQTYLRLGKSHSLPPGQAEQEAIKAISTGMALDATIPQFSLLKAVVLASQTGRDREAEQAFKRAVEADPGNARPHFQYALFLRERRPESAFEEMSQARSLDPFSSETTAYAGSILLFKGDLDGADKLLQTALRLNPDLPLTMRFLGDLEEKRGRPQQATDWYQRAATASGGNPYYIYRLGLAYARSGRELDTKTTLQKLLTRSQREFVDPAYIHNLQAALGS
ncbi:MAG TPA: winged helix-turn-helix domain-containing protein [Terriglobales bacterium]|nr:winged helix-turn-helix domain-containing protein [Terriglobales bacterium]